MLTGEGFLVMYSVTDRNSFEAAEKWIKQIQRERDMENFPCVLVGYGIFLGIICLRIEIKLTWWDSGVWR